MMRRPRPLASLAPVLFASALLACGDSPQGAAPDDDEDLDSPVGGSAGSAPRPRPTGGAGGGTGGGAGATGGTGGSAGASAGGSGGRGGSGGGTADAGMSRDGGSGGSGGSGPDAGGSSSAPDAGGSAADAQAPNPDDMMKKSDFVFQDRAPDTWTLTIAPADLAKMNSDLANSLRETYVPATLKIGEADLGKVAVRYKGAFGTLQSCVSPAKQITCKKLSMKIDFDRYDAEKRYYGLKKVNLHSQRVDSTQLREKLAYWLFRQMQIPAPRSAHARVVVNGEYRGLYGVTEQVDGRFSDYWFPKGEGDGNIYKETWPTNRDSNYYARQQKTNENDPGKVPPTKIVRAANAILNASDADLTRVVDQWMNLDYMLKFIAVDRAVTNWDGPNGFYCGGPTGGCGNHNFYIYEHQTRDRLYLVPWDLDNTFQVYSWWDAAGLWNDPSPRCGQNTQVFTNWLGHPGCDRIYRGVARAGRTRYAAALTQLLDGPYKVTELHGRIDRWAALIQDAVMADMNGAGFMGWQQGVSNLKRDLVMLRQKMEAIRDGMDPRPVGLRTNTVNGFESLSDLVFRMGVTAGVTTNSTIEHSLNKTAPLAGAADIRFTFELKNSTEDATGAYRQLAYVRVAFTAPTVDLRNLRQVRLKLKSDVTRPVRLEFGSSKYNPAPAMGRAGRLGWETMATAAGNTVTLDVANLGLAPGTTPNGDTAANVLSAANQIYIHAQPTNRNGQGLMPAGTSQSGWLQIDDIELITN